MEDDAQSNGSRTSNNTMMSTNSWAVPYTRAGGTPTKPKKHKKGGGGKKHNPKSQAKDNNKIQRLENAVQWLMMGSTQALQMYKHDELKKLRKLLMEHYLLQYKDDVKWKAYERFLSRNDEALEKLQGFKDTYTKMMQQNEQNLIDRMSAVHATTTFPDPTVREQTQESIIDLKVQQLNVSAPKLVFTEPFKKFLQENSMQNVSCSKEEIERLGLTKQAKEAVDKQLKQLNVAKNLLFFQDPTRTDMAFNNAFSAMGSFGGRRPALGSRFDTLWER